MGRGEVHEDFMHGFDCTMRTGLLISHASYCIGRTMQLGRCCCGPLYIVLTLLGGVHLHNSNLARQRL